MHFIKYMDPTKDSYPKYFLNPTFEKKDNLIEKWPKELNFKKIQINITQNIIYTS